MYYHWQNLTGKGFFPRAGRCWLHCSERHSQAIGFEWSLLSGRFAAGLEFSTGDGDELKFQFCFGLASLYLTLPVAELVLAALLPYRELPSTRAPGETFRLYKDREIRLAVHNGQLWWTLWVHPDEWCSSEPWYRRGNFSPARFLLGKEVHIKRPIETVGALVPMPEREYPCTVTLFESTWKRPRWPWARRLLRAEVEMATPIPFPGSGESEWNCGEDAAHSLTVNAATVDEAIAAMVAAVSRDRRKNGGALWRPSQEAAIA